MNQLKGKVAVITGAGSGIGLGIARTLAREGMSIALLDVRSDTLAHAAANVRELGGTPLPLAANVADRAALREAAAEIARTFGNVHVVCNNAGVAVAGKKIAETTDEEWEWVLATNVLGEVNVIKAFLPAMLAHGEEGHIVNTASIGGFQVRAGKLTGPYAVTKFGVVALTEALAHDLEGTKIGISVLAPAAVNTNIRNSSAALDPLGMTDASHDRTPQSLRAGFPPDLVGRRVLSAIRNGDFYVFTHVETRAWLEERHAKIIAGFDATERWMAEEERIAGTS